MMTWASVFCALFTVSGLWSSYVWDLPTGASTIVTAGIIYFLLVSVKTAWEKRRRSRTG
jgi:ABC-type Mn2+/Zn2+ transport system permease subunit